MSEVILTDEERLIKLQRSLADLNLTGNLEADLAATNAMRAQILNVVKEKLKEPRLSAQLVQSAGGLLKDIDEQFLKREKLAVEKTSADSALLIAEATAALLKGGNPYLRVPVGDDLEVEVDTSALAAVDAAVGETPTVPDHHYIGVQQLDYDDFAVTNDDDDDD